MRRSVRLALLPLLLAVLTTGCWSRIEINDLAIVTMMAVDRTEEGALQLWLHVVLPTRAGRPSDGGGGGQGPAFITVTARGQTILDAAHSIQTEIPRRIFWAHARVILIGERLAREGVQPLVDFVTRQRERRLNNYVILVRGSIPDFMGNQVDLEKLPGEYLREVSHARIGTATQVKDWVRMLSATGIQPTLGAVVAERPPTSAPEGQKSELHLNSTALFRGQRLAGFLDEHLSRGLQWLRGEVQRGVVTLELPGIEGFISLDWVSSQVDRRARQQGQGAAIDIAVRLVANISEVGMPLDLSDPATIDRVEQAISLEVRRRMETALAEMRRVNVDGAGIGEVIHRHLPGLWKRLEPNWFDRGFQQTPVRITVNSKVHLTGLTNRPKGVPEEELIRGGR